MRVVSINVGGPRTIESGDSVIRTGIFKQPNDGPVDVGPDGLSGDAICNRRHHGGPDQAVYVYTRTDYDWWSVSLGRVVEPGTFGENLTVSDLESARVRVGDRLTIGNVTLEATAPRIPCGTLAVKMNDPSFVVRFRAAERPGFYCRVLSSGAIKPGDPVRYVAYTGESVSVLEMFRDYYEPVSDEATIHRHLAAPIAARNRVRKERELQELAARVRRNSS